MAGIHDTAHIADGALIGDDVTIGPFTVVHGNVSLGAGTTIGSHCEIGVPSPLATGGLDVGKGSLIRSHSVLYAGSTFGEQLETGHHVTLREGLRVGVNLRVGTASELHGDSVVGNYVRLHSSVLVGKQATIGNFVWIHPYTVLTNDKHPPSEGPYTGPTIHDFAVIAAHCCIAPGVEVGANAVVGAGSLVTGDIPYGMLAYGSPARVQGPASAIASDDGRPAYPWQHHFHRGVPPDVIDGWLRGSGA